MRKVLATGAAVFTVLCGTALAAEQQPPSSRSTIEFEGRTWTHDAGGRVSVEEYRGMTALCVYGGTTASVYLPDVEFQDGTIEVDVAAMGRSTPGIGFRGRDHGNWRNTVLFNHWRANDQQTSGGVEQAVVTRRTGTVLVLNIRKSGEDAIPGGPDGPEWFHVKVVVEGGKVQVYLDGSEEPSIEVGAMFDPNEKGALGLCGRHFYFANFRYTTVE